jgi:hypothetical protein
MLVILVMVDKQTFKVNVYLYNVLLPSVFNVINVDIVNACYF